MACEQEQLFGAPSGIIVWSAVTLITNDEGLGFNAALQIRFSMRKKEAALHVYCVERGQVPEVLGRLGDLQANAAWMRPETIRRHMLRMTQTLQREGYEATGYNLG